MVIGARGGNESTVHGPTLGGTALKCLTATRLPLLLVRRTVTGPYAKVLAAIDASPTSRGVLAWALELSRHTVSFEVFHAFEAPFASRLRAHDVAEAALDVLVIA